jgi:hypothetical protein
MVTSVTCLFRGYKTGKRIVSARGKGIKDSTWKGRTERISFSFASFREISLRMTSFVSSPDTIFTFFPAKTVFRMSSGFTSKRKALQESDFYFIFNFTQEGDFNMSMLFMKT